MTATDQPEVTGSHHETTEQAERNVLGAIMLSSGGALDFLKVEPAHYRSHLHEQIHTAAIRLRSRGVPADQLTIGDELTKAGVRFEAAYLHHLAEDTVTPASSEHYGRIVTAAALRRQADQAALTIRQMCAEHADPETIQEAALKAFDGITPAAATDPVRFMAETLAETIEELDSDPVSTPTPWPSVDKMLGGIKPGSLYTFGARPGVGKSVVAVQLATTLARTGSVAFISLEMRTADLHSRAISAAAKVSISDMENRTLSAEDWERIGRVAPELETLPMAVLDRTSASIGDIRRFVTATARREPLAAVVVDYLQLIKKPPGDQRPRHEYIADLTRELKTLAMELDVPVILLSQLNRASTTRDSKMPELSDLRESGAIEQDSDVVILLHRLPDDPDLMHEITFRVAKNRRGRPGICTLDFAGHYSTIRDHHR